MMTAAQIADALGSTKRDGAGWRCRCSAHSDNDPGLAITERDGKRSRICRAGCGQDTVTAWEARPSKPVITVEGAVAKVPGTGKIQYMSVLRWREKEMSQRFSDGVIALIRVASDAATRANKL